MGTTTSPERLIVTNYAEGVRDLLVNISAVDYYKNVVASTSTRVQISVDSSQESCLFNTDSAGIFGSLTAYTVAGVATVTNFGARCAPGGTLNVSITSTVVKAPAALSTLQRVGQQPKSLLYKQRHVIFILHSRLSSAIAI